MTTCVFAVWMGDVPVPGKSSTKQAKPAARLLLLFRFAMSTVCASPCEHCVAHQFVGQPITGDGDERLHWQTELRAHGRHRDEDGVAVSSRNLAATDRIGLAGKRRMEPRTGPI
jgi:hypothetical protein